MPPEKVNINDAPKMEDIFIDDDFFSDAKIEDDDKQYIDDLLQQVNHSDMHMPIPPPTFNDIFTKI